MAPVVTETLRNRSSFFIPAQLVANGMKLWRPVIIITIEARGIGLGRKHFRAVQPFRRFRWDRKWKTKKHSGAEIFKEIMSISLVPQLQISKSFVESCGWQFRSLSTVPGAKTRIALESKAWRWRRSNEWNTAWGICHFQSDPLLIYEYICLLYHFVSLFWCVLRFLEAEKFTKKHLPIASGTFSVSPGYMPIWKTLNAKNIASDENRPTTCTLKIMASYSTISSPCHLFILEIKIPCQRTGHPGLKMVDLQEAPKVFVKQSLADELPTSTKSIKITKSKSAKQKAQLRCQHGAFGANIESATIKSDIAGNQQKLILFHSAAKPKEFQRRHPTSCPLAGSRPWQSWRAIAK